MSEELLVRHGAPTLAGMKTGSLFSCACGDAAALRKELRRLNRMLAPRGLCLLLLRQTEGRALLYLYRPARLRRDLADGGAQALLRQSGYGCESCGRCIAQLIRRLQAGGAQNVLVSMGAEGALLLAQDGAAYHAVCSARGEVVSTVGAGDSLVAGFLSQETGGEAALRMGVACG